MTAIAYIKPESDEMFRLGKKDLQELAAGRGKRAEQAKAELARRAANKAAKKAAS